MVSGFRVMDAIAGALADPRGRIIYLVFCFALLIVPMLALALRYRARVARSAGGRAAMKEQARIGVRTVRSWQAAGFACDIAAGRYGADIRTLQVTTCWLAGAWLLVNAVAFGLLIWADEVNRP